MPLMHEPRGMSKDVEGDFYVFLAGKFDGLASCTAGASALRRPIVQQQ